MSITSLINGASVPGEAGTLTSTNPAQLSDVVAEVSLASPGQVLDAFRAARAAQPGWAATPAPVRGQVIAKIGRLVEANAEALAALVTREVGKPLAEARGEVREGLAHTAVAETASALLVQRWLLTGERVDEAYADEVVTTVVLPLVRERATAR